MPRHDPGPRVRLRAGIRVTSRGEGELQVGSHPDQRVVLPDHEPVRRLLDALDHGVDPAKVAPAMAATLAGLRRRGLAVPARDPGDRARLLGATRVQVVAPDAARAAAERLLGTVGLGIARGTARPLVGLHVSLGAEPRREDLDHAMRAERPHLPLTFLAGRARLGPFVAPGLTACVRCVDEHLTDRDPRHPLVVQQHHDPDPRDAPSPEDLQLALAWAVRDLVTWVDGGRPSTWSTTADLRPEGPRLEQWRRHPRCGCAWGDVLAG